MGESDRDPDDRVSDVADASSGESGEISDDDLSAAPGGGGPVTWDPRGEFG